MRMSATIQLPLIFVEPSGKNCVRCQYSHFSFRSVTMKMIDVNGKQRRAADRFISFPRQTSIMSQQPQHNDQNDEKNEVQHRFFFLSDNNRCKKMSVFVCFSL